MKRILLSCLIALFLINGTNAQTAGSLRFDGSNDSVTVVPSGGTLDMSYALTVEAWIKPAKFTGTQDVVSKSSITVNNGYIFPRTTDGWQNFALMINIRGTGWVTVSASFTAAPSAGRDKWNHVAATYDGVNVKLYLNGTLVKTQALTGTITTNTNKLLLGAHSGYSNEFFGGTMDEVRIWDRALTDCEIQNNMHCELTGTQNGLAAYYKFNQGIVGVLNSSFSNLPDESGNGNDGTLVNFFMSGVSNSNFLVGQISGNCTLYTPPVATAGSNGSMLLAGTSIHLSATGGTTYSWTGPNGFTSTEQNPVITNAQPINSGTYTVTVSSGGCSSSASTVVTVALPGGALHFNGGDNVVTVPFDSSLQTNEAITIETWIYPTSTREKQSVLSKATLDNNVGYVFPRTDDGWHSFTFYLNIEGVGWRAISAPYPGINEWHHVAATYDGFFMRIYLDGNLSASLAVTGVPAVNSNLVTIGQHPGYPEAYTGNIEEARIWSRALTQCEIQNNSSCELPGGQNGLVAYYKFNQGLASLNNAAYTNAWDASGKGNTGVLTGFTLNGDASNWVVGNAHGTCSVYVPFTATAGSNAPIIPVGSTLQLTASGGTSYSWTGPGNFTSSLQNPTVPAAQIPASGNYTVTISNGGCTTTQSVKVQVAYLAGTLTMDGVNDMITVPANSSQNTRKAITLETWVFPTNGTTPVQDIFCKSTRENNTGYIFPRTDDGWRSFVFYLHVGGEWKKLSAPYPALNEWHHLAATYDGYFMRIYMDGRLVGTLEAAGDITENANDLMLGQQPGFNEYFGGSLDESRLWDRALNQCEIINNMNCELDVANTNGLVAYYRYNQGFVDAPNTGLTTLEDSSPESTNNGTLTDFALDGLVSNWSAYKITGTCAVFAQPPVTALSNGSIFGYGSTIRLFADGGTTYTWDGPNNYTSTNQNPIINNAQSPQTGVYTVTAPFVNCVVTASTRVTVSPLAPIVADGPTTFCPSGSVTLSTPNTGIAYQWYKNDVAIPSATGRSYTANQTGSYTVTVTDAHFYVLVSAPISINVVDNQQPIPDVASLPALNGETPANITFRPTATDNCSGVLTGTTTDPLTYAIPGTYTIHWTYNDGNGNSFEQTQQVIIAASNNDQTAPVINVPANIVTGTDNNICAAVVNFAATATDNSGVAPTITYSHNPGTQFAKGTTIVTVTAVDGSNNTATATFTVTVNDTQAPVITAPADQTVNLGTTINIGTATATDNCGGTPTISNNSTGVFPLGVTTITWTATDAAGNSATATQKITVVDATAPVLNVPANIVVNNTAGVCGAAVTFAATATDNSGAAPTITYSTNPGTVFPVGTTTVTVTAKDAANNTTTGTFTVKVNDVQAPAIVAPADITVGSGTGVTLISATATDNCGTVTITRSAVPAVYPLGTTIITWTATDATGNTATATQKVIVKDVTPPVLVGVPANVAVTCGEIPAVPTVTATDNFDPNPVVTMTTVTTTTTVTRTWTAKDASNNTSTAQQVITVSYGSAPSIAGPVSGSVVTQNPLAAALDFNIFAQTTVSFSGGQSHGPVALGGDLTLGGDHSVSNNSAGSFKVSNVPVTLVVGGKINYNGGNGMNINQNGYVKIGNANGSTAWYKDQNNAYSPIRITPNSNYNGSPRLNLQVNSQAINVSATNNPVFQSGLIDFAAAFTQLKASATSLSALTDNMNLTNSNGSAIPHSNLPNQVKMNLVDGVNVLNVSGTDLNRLSDFIYNSQPSASRIVIVNVNAPGSFSWNVANSGGIGDGNTPYILYNFYNTTSLTVQGNGAVMGTLFAPYANISRGGNYSQNITGQIVGQSFVHPNGTNNYTKFAGTITSGSTTTIASGSNNARATNTTSCTYIVNGTEFNATATATDNCSVPVLTYTLSGATTGTGSNLAGVALNKGTTTVTWTATNASGSATYSFTVTVTDGVNPIAIAKNVTVSLDASGNASVTAQAVNNGSSDNCGIATYTLSKTSFTAANLGANNVTLTVTDASGNSATATAVVTVNDVTAPVIAPVANIARNNDNNVCGAVVTFATTATDNSGAAPTITYSPASGTTFPVGTTTVTVTAKDASNNTSTATFTVTVTDTQLPKITAPANVSITLTNGGTSVSYANANVGTATASDNCGTPVVTNNAPTAFPVGTTVITWTAKDASNNTATENQTVTVTSYTVDNVKPVITAMPAQSFCVEADGTYTLPLLSATDNVGVTAISYKITGATSRTGTGNNASGRFSLGTSTITWTVADAKGNTSTSTTTVKVNAVPTASLTSAVQSSFVSCDAVILTAKTASAYKWELNGVTVGTNQDLTLGQANGEGSYKLTITDANGCSSTTPATYSFQKQNNFKSYAILAYRDVKLGQKNVVTSGSVGSMGYGGEIDLQKNSSVNSDGSFVKASKIDKHGSNIIIANQLCGVVNVTLPAMYYNNASLRNLSNKEVSQNSTTTLSGNYNSLNIRKGANVTLTGTIFGDITIEAGAQVKFTAATVNIDELKANDGPNNGYSYIKFNGNTNVLIGTQVALGSNIIVNPDAKKVTFYVGDNSRCSDNDAKFTIKGNDVIVDANIYMPKGRLVISGNGVGNDHNNDSHDYDDDDHHYTHYNYDGCDNDDHNGRHNNNERDCNTRENEYRRNSSFARNSSGHSIGDVNYWSWWLGWFCGQGSSNGTGNNNGTGNGNSDELVYMTGTFIAEYVESKVPVIWNGNSCSGTSIATSTGTKQTVTQEETPATTASKENVLNVTVMPNPTTTFFTFKLESNNQAPVTIRVVDGSGRLVDAKSNVNANSTLQMGHSYTSGTFFAEFTQGTTRKVIQLIKVKP